MSDSPLPTMHQILKRALLASVRIRKRLMRPASRNGDERMGS